MPRLPSTPLSHALVFSTTLFQPCLVLEAPCPAHPPKGGWSLPIGVLGTKSWQPQASMSQVSYETPNALKFMSLNSAQPALPQPAGTGRECRLMFPLSLPHRHVNKIQGIHMPTGRDGWNALEGRKVRHKI